MTATYALAGAVFVGWCGLVRWIKQSPIFDDPLTWDEVEDWWQAWVEGRL